MTNTVDWMARRITEIEQAAAEKERERIIKVLEAERWELPNGIPAGGEIYLPIEQAIALIKGEQK